MVPVKVAAPVAAADIARRSSVADTFRTVAEPVSVEFPVTPNVPVTVVFPLRETEPVPVPNVPVQTCEKLPLARVRPVRPENDPPEVTSQLVVSIVRVFAFHPIVTAPVEVPVLIEVVKFELVLMLELAPEIVAPAVAVRRVLNVLAPQIV